MLEPLRTSFLLKVGWVCGVGARINEVFELSRIAHVPPSLSLHFRTLSKAVYPAHYPQHLPRSYLYFVRSVSPFKVRTQ